MSTLIHRPVMLAEVLAAMALKPGMRVADFTLGRAGHSEAILRETGPDGRLYAFDCDEAAIRHCQASLADAGYSGRFELHYANYADAGRYVAAGTMDAVLVDCGVSSPQLDDGAKGMSFMRDGPLDMRLGGLQTTTAAELVAAADVDELTRIFGELGGEPEARRLARAVVRHRDTRRFMTTVQFAEFIEQVLPRHGARTHPATRAFLGLRRAVNDDVGSLERGLEAAWSLLKPMGRLVTLTFFSGEDRIVKEFGRNLAREYIFEGDVDLPEFRTPRAPLLRWVHRKPLKPSEDEVRENPRARSVLLRAMIKLTP